MDLYPEFDAELDEIQRAAEDAAMDEDDTPQGDRFRVDSLDKATWALRRLAAQDAELDEALATAKREQDRITAWADDQKRRHERRTRYLRSLLERYHRERLEQDPKAKTIRLPAGELRARPAQDRWDYDTAAFVAWAEGQRREDLLRRPDPEPNKKEVRKALAVAEHDPGEPGPMPVIDPATGETIPGITVTPGETRYTAHPHLGGDLT